VGNFWDLISIYSILGGLVTLSGFILQGSIFLSLKLDHDFAEKIRLIGLKVWIPAVVIMFAFVIETYFFTDILVVLGVNPGIVPIGAIISLLSVGWFIQQKRLGWAFIINSLAILFSASTIFRMLYPRVLVSSLDPSYSLTIFNASSGPYTLRVMTIIAGIFLPIVLAYQGWSYWIFRKRITSQPEDLHY
jgi:cytochrome d ubiquinol oxidase subunit II